MITLAKIVRVLGLCGILLASGCALADELNMRVFTLSDHLFAFYDGRPPEPKELPKAPDWAAYGALNVGVCSYVIHQGNVALVFDTFPSVQQAQWVRDYLVRAGITHFIVVNSHWHLDHVGGNAVYADADRIATQRTIATLRQKKTAIEAGTEWGPPRVDPLVIPNIGIDRLTRVYVGDVEVELRPVNIHTVDGLVLYLPAERILLAGDTLEDTLTFITEPEGIPAHLRNLAAMRRWGIERILPNHGDPARIAQGGYAPTLIDATVSYLRKIRARAGQPQDTHDSVEDYVGDSIAKGWVSLWWAYREAHADNLKEVAAALGRVPAAHDH